MNLELRKPPDRPPTGRWLVSHANGKPDLEFRDRNEALRYVVASSGPLDLYNEHGEHQLSKGAENRPEAS